MIRGLSCIALLIAAALSAAQVSLTEYPLFLLHSTAVQKELKLSPVTMAKLTKIEKAANARYMEMIRPDPSHPDQIRQPDPVALRKARLKDDAAMLALLSNPQKQRLLQIGYQYNGAFSFAQPAVAQRLKLSAAQKKKFEAAAKSAMDQYRKAVAPIMRPGSIAGAQRRDLKATTKRLVEAKLAMMKSVEASANAILTAAQRSAWKQLKGKPFNVVPLYGRMN